MNIEDYFHYYQLEYKLTEHYLDDSKFFDIILPCSYCVAKHSFFPSSFYKLFEKWIKKRKDKNEINKLVEKINSSCSCKKNKKYSDLDFKKLLSYFVIFLGAKEKLDLWEYNEDFFKESLNKTYLTQYKNNFDKEFIICFYDLKIVKNLEKYLVNVIKMKRGHAARLIRYYECRLKSK